MQDLKKRMIAYRYEQKSLFVVLFPSRDARRFPILQSFPILLPRLIRINNQMGLFYSLTSYFSPPPAGVLTEVRIRTSSQKLIVRIRNLQYKLQQEVFKAEEELVGQVRQPLAVRSRDGERIRMDRIIKISEKRLVYDEVIYCLNKVIAEAKALETAPTSVSNECLLAVCSIIHVYARLGLNEFVSLSEFLPQPHPNIDVSKIRPLLQRYLQKEEASPYERNLYAVELCTRSGLSLPQINQSGHNFVAEPVEPAEQTPSFQMFAVTLEEVALEEQA